MAKKCIYCSTEVSEDSVIDFCKRCGVGVWGEKMFNTIVNNMENARENGDLCHNKKDNPSFETISKTTNGSLTGNFQSSFR